MSKIKQPKNAGWRRVANFFGVLGYLSVLVEWTWVAALYMPLILENQAVKDLLLPDSSNKPNPIIEAPPEPSVLALVVALGITFIVVVVSVILLIRIPLKLAKTSHKVIEKTAVASIPILTHHKKISPKKKRLLTARIISWIKIIAAVLPVTALFGIYFIELSLSREIFVIIGVILAGMALTNFTLQYLVARWKSIPADSLL